jgi:hypothetical protein
MLPTQALRYGTKGSAAGPTWGASFGYADPGEVMAGSEVDPARVRAREASIHWTMVSATPGNG